MGNTINENVPYKDFKRIYKVFGEKPYEEKYTEEDFREIYDEYISKGKIFGAYVNDELVGIIAITYGAKSSQPVNFGDKKVLYLSDVAVDSEFRKRGLGTRLMAYVIATGKQEKFNTIYMRTLKEGSMSASIAKKLGFSVVEGVEQDVTTESIYGSNQTKKNIFLQIDLDALDRKGLKEILNKAKYAKTDPDLDKFLEKEDDEREEI